MGLSYFFLSILWLAHHMDLIVLENYGNRLNLNSVASYENETYEARLEHKKRCRNAIL
jgi:hypothetical protein